MNEWIDETQIMLGIHEEGEADTILGKLRDNYPTLSVEESSVLSNIYAKLCGIQVMQVKILDILEK